jgi:hypothetical protein
MGEFKPIEEEMFAKAECPTCFAKTKGDGRAWAHQHVRETGHPVYLTIGYDVRDENWMARLSPERQAEIKGLVEDPQSARTLTEQLLRDAKGETTN